MRVVDLTGFKPATFRLSTDCSLIELQAHFGGRIDSASVSHLSPTFLLGSNAALGPLLDSVPPTGAFGTLHLPCLPLHKSVRLPAGSDSLKTPAVVRGRHWRQQQTKKQQGIRLWRCCRCRWLRWRSQRDSLQVCRFQGVGTQGGVKLVHAADVQGVVNRIASAARDDVIHLLSHYRDDEVIDRM